MDLAQFAALMRDLAPYVQLWQQSRNTNTMSMAV